MQNFIRIQCRFVGAIEGQEGRSMWELTFFLVDVLTIWSCFCSIAGVGVFYV